MGDISKNISRHEIRCHCDKGCGYEFMSGETIAVVQDVCDYFATLLGLDRVTLNIHSAARCPVYNAQIGGVEGSKHVRSGAIDFNIVQVAPHLVADYLETKYPGRYGIGRYKGFTHIDTRYMTARWEG